MRITSQIGDTPIFRAIHQIYQHGGTIAGTSAGAAAMSETMVAASPKHETPTLEALNMAAGLDFLHGVVIDSHFAERGRMGRLLVAVAQNPSHLGLGIDEDTALLVEDATHFSVLGSGAVYVVDGAGITFSSLDEERSGIVSIYDVKVHVLAEGDQFDLGQRRPLCGKPD
jgi:cyanophycinase